MTRQPWTVFLMVTVAASFVMSGGAHAQYAAAVVSYEPGTSPASGFTQPGAAIGEPERFSGEGVFPGIVSPVSPPFLASEIVSIGEGGHLTLRLSHYAIPQPAGLEIGVFTNVGITYDFVGGVATTPAGTFGADSAQVEVSEDGTQWISLGNSPFDLPTNGYTDVADPFSATAGSALSDFQQPFIASVSDFDGLPYADAGGPDMLELLAGSGGGTWLDISGTGLAKVGFVRFLVASLGSDANFELDGISIAHGSVGAFVPEPTTVNLGCLVLMLSACFRREHAR